jgi:hypothetical protein
VGTRFGSNNATNIFLKGLHNTLMVFGLRPEEGAKTIVYLAASPDVEDKSGGYYYKCKRDEPSVAARNDEDALRLWQESAKLARLA